MISIIIPIFNEDEVLKHYDTDFFSIVDELKQQLNETFEVLLIDDGSRDGSYALISDFAKRRDDTIGVRHAKNRGMGSALKTGIEQSYGDLLIFLDADLTFKPRDMKTLIEEYRRDPADCIIGSPYIHRGLMSDVRLGRLILSTCVNILYRMVLGREVRSVSPIFRLYRREVFRKISLTSENFEINAEILSKMVFRHMAVREVPVALHKRKFGASKAKLIKSMRNHIRILYKIFSVRYLKREWT